MSDRKTALTGVALACLSTSLGGMTVAFTRAIIGETDPLSLTFVRYGIGAMVLLAFAMATVKMPRFERRDAIAMIPLAIVMFAVFPYFMAKGLEDTTAAHGGLLFATMPMITMILGAIFGVESLTRPKTAAVALTLVGAWVALGETVGTLAPNALRGDLFMFAGMVCASSFNVFSKRYLTRYGSQPVIVYTMFVGVAGLLVLALLFGKPFSGSLDFDLRGWLIVLALAVPGAAIMVGAWGHALHLITPTQATITIGLNPLTAILLGVWMLGEPASPRILAGFALIVSAIVIANYGRARNGGIRTLS